MGLWYMTVGYTGQVVDFRPVDEENLFQKSQVQNASSSKS